MQETGRPVVKARERGNATLTPILMVLAGLKPTPVSDRFAGLEGEASG